MRSVVSLMGLGVSKHRPMDVCIDEKQVGRSSLDGEDPR